MNNGDPSQLPTSVVIFGASGDLTKRKLVPALYNQFTKGRLTEPMNIVGFSRRPYDHNKFRQLLLEGMQELTGLKPQGEEWERFADKLWYVQGNLNEESDSQGLQAFLKDIENGISNRLYYLPTAPSFFPGIIEHIGHMGMVKEDLSRKIEGGVGPFLGAAYHAMASKPFYNYGELLKGIKKAIDPNVVYNPPQIYPTEQED